jgi:prepilin-type N-terminal cleavage/methylation domain-containing protein
LANGAPLRWASMRRAFTLPEVLVAILVLSIGILGLASTGTFIAIQAGEARAITEGAVLAGRALDSLRAMPCASITAGQLTQGPATVRWTAVPGPRSLSIDATLELTHRRGNRQWPISGLVPC